MGIEKETESRSEVVKPQPRSHCGLDVRNAVGQGESDLLHRS